MNDMQHEFDRHALAVARGIGAIDRERLSGSQTQYVDILHQAIYEAMVVAFKARASLPDNYIAELAAREADARPARAYFETLGESMARLVHLTLAAVNGDAPATVTK